MPTITKRIALTIRTKEKDELKGYYDLLFKYQRIAYKGANIVSSHLFFQEKMADMVYLSEGIKLKMVDMAKDEEGVLTTSKMNTTYQVLSKMFKGEIPSTILTALNSTVSKTFNKERNEYFIGERSLRSYKKDMPIPFPSAAIKGLQLNPDTGTFQFDLFNIPFEMFLGIDRGNIRGAVNSILAGEFKFSDSSLQLKQAKNKEGKKVWRVYLLMAVSMPSKEGIELDESKVAYAELGIEVPIRLTIGKKTFDIGNREEYLYRRLAIQSKLQRLSKNLKFAAGGKGICPPKLGILRP